MSDLPVKFEGLYHRYHTPVVRYIATIVGPTEAADVAQEVFVKIDNGLAHFEGRAKIATWIYRIATNTAIDWLRSRRRHRSELPIFSTGDEHPAGCTGEAMASAVQGPSEQIITAEMNDCIRQQLNRLPEKYRTVMVLSSLEELDSQEVANILGISRDAAKIRLHRGRALLKKILESECRFYNNPATGALACDRKKTRIF